MKRYKQFDSLIVSDFERDEWADPIHNHNHFELIYIAKGSGLHHLNNVKFPYKKGDLFLLGPEDMHEFEISRRSRFIYFKFTKLYITTTNELPMPDHWNRDIDQLLYNSERKKGNLLQNEADQKLVLQLMDMIVTEYSTKKLLNEKVIFQLFTVIILLIKRNKNGVIHKHKLKEHNGIAEEILEYIELNIYDPQKLTIKNLANHFHYSPNYIGILFKDKVGNSLREYISEYRYRLIEQRIKFGKIGMKQIASEFGFVDESHVYKFVKSKSGKRLREIKSF
ncbi:AraC family ligand binding domain-containing protein [Chondrinema litorale]|uniref:AraC family ligand binding domain-containing protein n=1 Tax=Chondrinema litorale TaxID=2994555 RepID=UPI00254293A7|nr:AraC family transcriptional regulator [Chondrinema litorale]UZR95397.1 AraC family transcriptional regulator [Chondrinema litorale]